MKSKSQRRHKILYGKISPIKRGKNHGAGQQNFIILQVFINGVGYLMIRLTLAGELQSVYIGGSNDPYRGGLLSSRPKPPDDGPLFARQKLAFI
jgi:hypothetical protein